MREASDPIPDPDPSVDSINELALDGRKKKRRAMVVLFGVVPLLAVVTGVAWWYFGEQAAEREIREAWSRASACLVGAPLADGQKASLRMRAIQLAAVHVERDQKQESRWPARCGDVVAELHEALRTHGRNKDGDEGLAARAEQFAVQLRKAEVMHDLSVPVDGLFEAAAKMGLSADPATLQVPTPDPAVGLDLDSLPETARLTPLQYTLDSVTSTPMIDTDIHVLVYDKKVGDTPLLCTFTPSGADRCRELGGELVGKSGLRLGGTVDEGANPLVMAGQEGDDGIYRSDGTFEKVATMATQSAYVAKDGYVAIAGFSKDRHEGYFDLMEQPAPGAPVVKRRVEPEQIAKGVQQVHRKSLLWGKLMVQALFEQDESQYKSHLMYADLPVVGDRPVFHDIAEVNWLNARLFGCRTPEAMVVGVGVSAGFLVFLEGDKWSSPVKIDSISGAFGCHAGEGVFTTSYGGQNRCTPAGCKLVDGVQPTFEPFPVRDVYWADLSGKIIAVAVTERRGGLRYRYAEGANLGVAGGDRLLFDDLIHDGAVKNDTTALGILLAGRGTFAVVLLTTPKGVYALRVDADGVAKPAKIVRM